MTSPQKIEKYGSVSLITQGNNKFYSLTLPSSVLEKCCFVISREEEPIEGFQRELDQKRADEIADYIDNHGGSIPNAIILSAQDDSNFEYNSKTKGITFTPDKRAFLIIDGQHRVFGFIKAKTELRVPVIIYSGLSKIEETRLFIDINSKQKGVPPELLLDIKKLAQIETTQEEFMREVFDLFNKEIDSILSNKLSPAKRVRNKISRPVFNTALKPLIKIFGAKEPYEIYEILNSYFIAFDEAVLGVHQISDLMTSTIVFKAICGFFPKCASKLKDKHGAIYNVENFHDILVPVGANSKKSKFSSSGNAYIPLIDHLEESLKTDFTL